MVSEMPVAELKLGRVSKGLGRFFRRHGINMTEIGKQEILVFAASIPCHPSLLQLPGKGTDRDESLSLSSRALAMPILTFQSSIWRPKELAKNCPAFALPSLHTNHREVDKWQQFGDFYAKLP